MKKRLAFGLSVFISTVLLFSGCSSSTQETTSNESATETTESTESTQEETKEVEGTAAGQAHMEAAAAGAEVTVANGKGAGRDSLNFIVLTEPLTLEPGGLSSTDSNVRPIIVQVYETLVRESPTDRTVLQPLLCEGWEFNDEGTQVTFEIKQGVKFHDGTEMTADDVAYSLNRSINLPTNVDISDMMENAEVVDDTHVVLNLSYPYSPVVNILTNPGFSIVSQAYIEQCEADGTNFGRNPMGTGAYRFVSWTNGANIKFESFDEWHGGEVAIPNLTYTFIADTTTAAIALENGDGDLFYGVDSADLPRLRANPDVNVMSVQSSGFYFVALNTRVEALSDIRVRQAIAKAINRQEVIDGGQDGVGWTVECPITPGIFGYQEEFEATPQDIEGAKQLLADAGYADGLTLTMITPEASYYSRPAQVVQEQLRQIGIDCQLTIMERGAFDTDVSNREFELCYTWYGASYPDADNIVYKMFHSDFADGTGTTNIAGVKSEEADRIIEDARRSIDQDVRYELYGELSAINDENAWYIPILCSTNTICASAEVGGVAGNAGSYYYVADYTFEAE